MGCLRVFDFWVKWTNFFFSPLSLGIYVYYTDKYAYKLCVIGLFFWSKVSLVLIRNWVCFVLWIAGLCSELRLERGFCNGEGFKEQL